MSDPITSDGPGELLLPASSASAAASSTSAPDAARALTVVSRLARSHPLSNELRGLLEGKLG